MDSLHSGLRASYGSSLRLSAVVVLVTAATYGLGAWGTRELVSFEPHTVEVDLLVPRLDESRLASALWWV